MKIRRLNESAEFNFNSAASSGNWPYKMSIETYANIRDEISQIIDNLDQSSVFAIARDANKLGLSIDEERLYYSPDATIETNISPEKINQFRNIVMRYSDEQLNEESNRKFYIDEIVSAPGGKTETERHSFATIDELKQYCKDAGLTKDDIANCGGCDVKDLCEGLEGSLHIQYCPSCGCQNEYSDSQDNGSWVRYTCRSCGNTWDIDKPQTKDAVNEEVEKLHTKPNGEYLVKADSGKGYTAFSRDNVVIGGIDNEDADSDDKAIDKFKRNEYSECLNEKLSSSQSALIRLDFLSLVDVFGSISLESYAEILSKKYKYSIDEICCVIQDLYNQGLNKTSPEAEHTETPPSEPIENNTSNERPSKRILKRLGINEEYLDTAEYRIQKYEDDIPELMAGMHDDYMEGKLDAARYAEVLKKVYDALAECDYKHTMSAPVKTETNSQKVMNYLDSLEEETEIKDTESLNEGSEKYYAAKYTTVDNSGNKTVKKICFRCDGTIEDAEKEVDALIKEPYTELKVIGSCLKGVAEKDGYKLIESVDKEEVVNMPRFSKLKAEVEKLAEKTGLTVYVSEPEHDGDNVDLWCKEIFDIEGTGLVDVIELSEDESEYLFDSDAIENHLVSVCLTDENEYDYDDDYSDAYDELLDECSGIKAHKVIMGEDIDDSIEFDDF